MARFIPPGAAKPASSRLDVEPGRLEAPPRRFGEAHVRTPETLHEDEDHRVEECGGGVRAGLDELVEALAVEREERHLGLGLDRRRARRAVQQAHLAEELARALAVQKLLDARLDDLRDEHGAAVDEEHLVARVTLAEEHLVLPERTLAQALCERSLRKNQVLFREGDPGDEMFLIHRGTVLVSKIVKARVEQLLNRQSAGEFFGEMSLLDGSPRSATIQAETEVTLLALDRKSLNQLIEASPHAAAAFFYAMVLVFMERLRGSDVRLTEATRWGLEATGLDVRSEER